MTRIGFDPKIPEFLPLWAGANGVDLLSEDGTEANIDDPAVVEALEYTASLIEAQGGWGAFKSFRDSWDFFGAENQFASNQLGAFPMEDWYLNVLNENSPDVALTAKPFMGVDGQPVDFVTGGAWVIPAGSDFPDQACEFIKTMTSSDAWIAAAEARAEAREAEACSSQASTPATPSRTRPSSVKWCSSTRARMGRRCRQCWMHRRPPLLPSSRERRVPDRLAERRQPGPGR